LFFAAVYVIQSRSLFSGGGFESRGEILGSTRASLTLTPPLLALYGITIAASFAVTGWVLVRRTFAPIVSLNDQLDAIDPNNLHVRVKIETDESELQKLEENINGLLSRISLNFHQLRDYSKRICRSRSTRSSKAGETRRTSSSTSRWLPVLTSGTSSQSLAQAFSCRFFQCCRFSFWCRTCSMTYPKRP
jgi:methyl-accepting chemotaxis protein